MSSTYAEPLDLVERGLDELAAIGPEFRSLDEKQEMLLRISRLISRAEAERLRVLAVSDDIAEETGDRSTATWLAHQTRDNHGTVRRHATLAVALGSQWTQTADALGAGDLNLAQARIIVEALEALPDGLGDDLVVKAEAYLVEQAGSFGPRDLPRLRPGWICDHVATGPPTSTPASPITSRPVCGPTWTPTPPHAAARSVRSTSYRWPAAEGRRSWRTCPTPVSPPVHG